MTPLQNEMFEVATSHQWDWLALPSGTWEFRRNGQTIRIWFQRRFAASLVVAYADFVSPTGTTTRITGGAAGVLRVLRL